MASASLSLATSNLPFSPASAANLLQGDINFIVTRTSASTSRNAARALSASIPITPKCRVPFRLSTEVITFRTVYCDENAHGLAPSPVRCPCSSPPAMLFPCLPAAGPRRRAAPPQAHRRREIATDRGRVGKREREAGRDPHHKV